MSQLTNIYEDAIESLVQDPSAANHFSWAAKLREAAVVEPYRGEFLANMAKSFEDHVSMSDLLKQIEEMGLKRNTMFGGAPTGRGNTGYWTHLAPKDSDFDPYVSPVFGETQYESLKEAITEWLSHDDYLELAAEFPTLKAIANS